VLAGFCAADRLERGGGNDGPEEATVLGGGAAELGGLRLCPGDEDWFSLQVVHPSTLQVELDGDAPPLELALLSADGVALLGEGQARPGGGLLLVVAELGAGS